MNNKNKYLALIESNIKKCGYHIYAVKDNGPLPRFCYSIGLTKEIGTELILAGALLYTDEEVKVIINEIVGEIKNDINVDNIVTSLGIFSLKTVDSTWSEKLMLGVFDYYNVSTVSVLQIIPKNEYLTIDVPDLSREYNPSLELIWKWLTIDWNFSISATSVCVTDLDTLQGKPIIQAIRWEEDYWEIFSKLSSEIIQENTRFIPIGMLLVIDKANEVFADLAINEAVSRIDSNHEWEFWDAEYK